MKNAVKTQVIDLFELQGQLDLFNQSEFNYYYRKHHFAGAHPYWLAIKIFDCWQFNLKFAKPPAIIEVI
jgi:hypothetical protein